MNSSNKLPRLEELWTTTELPCIACAKLIGNDALIRTFCPIRRSSVAAPLRCSRTITGTSWNLFFYDRHQSCLPPHVNLISVSHVWDPAVSKAHHQGISTPSEEQSRVVQYIFKSLECIIDGLSTNIDDNTEIWYDYVCVPQWNDERKEKIMRIIPDIFQNSSFVLVHLDDVSVEAVSLLREGNTTKRRISGITQICNAR